MKNILLIGRSSGIGYELTKKLEKDNNVFVSTRNPDKFTGSIITSNKLDYIKSLQKNILRSFGQSSNVSVSLQISCTLGT